MAWVSRSRACLAEPPARVALDDEDLGAVRGADACSRRACREAAACASPTARPISFSRLRCRRSSAWSTTQSSSSVACCGVVGEPVVEGVAHRALDDAGGLLRGEPVLGLALELGLADEHRQHGGGRAQHVVGGDLRGALVAGELAVGAQALATAPSAGRSRACRRRRRDGVAVGAHEAVLVGDPSDRPFDRAVAVRSLRCGRRRNPW